MPRPLTGNTRGIHVTFSKPVQQALDEMQKKIKESFDIHISKTLIIEFFVYHGLFKLHAAPSINDLLKYKNTKEQLE